MNDSADERDPLDELAAEFVKRHRRGERPSLTEYTERYPELADEIREVFPALVLMEEVRPDPPAAGGSSPGPQPPPLERLGDYRLLREVGRGGMGVVYEAEQESLGRRVALKVMLAHAVLDPRQVSRFQREARAAARLHHTNIVPVFGVGEANGLHYYVMQFIHGLSLDEVLAELKKLRQADGAAAAAKPDGEPTAVSVAQALLSGQTPLSAPTAADELSAAHLPGQPERSTLTDSGRQYWTSVARVGLQAAEALAYSHAQGTLHRDIKPSNLLLDTQGAVWVADFGLAKAADSEDLTHTGDVVGTLRYMAPERFGGRSDARSDVYSLGLTLYELLTLRPAFPETDRNKLLGRVLHEEPPRPRQCNPSAPADLETIVLKAMAKDPADRYPKAADLAEDLRRFLDDKPIRARPLGPVERLCRWGRRHPGTAGLAAALTLALVAGFVGVAWKWREAEWAYGLAAQRADAAQREQERAQRAEELAKERARDLEESGYFREVALAHREWLANNVGRARQLLDESRRDRPAWEWRYLQRLCHTELCTLEKYDGAIWSLAFSPDGQRLASAGGVWGAEQPSAGIVWDVASGKEAFRLVGHRGMIFSVAWSSGPRPLLATASADRSVRLWDATDGKELAAFTGPNWFRAVAFSPDGGRVAAASEDGSVWVWDAVRREALRRLNGPAAGSALSVAFSPDGKRLAVGRYGSGVQLWDLDEGRLAQTLYHYGNVLGVAFSPDGRLASSNWTGTIRLWAPDEKQVFSLRTTLAAHSRPVNALAFSRDGLYLVSVSDEGTVRLWDGRSGDALRTFRGHTGGLCAGAFSPDGKRLATGGIDRTVLVWDPATEQEHRTLDMTWPTHVYSLAFSADGQWLATPDKSHAGVPSHAGVKIWDPRTGQGVRVLDAPGGLLFLAFSPLKTEPHLAVGGADPQVKVWQVRTGTLLHTLQGHTGAITGVAYSGDGKRLASSSADGSVRIWELASGQSVHTLVGPKGGLTGVAFSGAGRLVAAGARDGTVLVWDARTAEERCRWDAHHRAITGLAFSPDGKLLASVEEDHVVILWDVDAGRRKHTLRGHSTRLGGLAFSPDGRRLATTGFDDRAVKLWDVASGEEILSLSLESVVSVAFSPDDRFIAAGNCDNRVRIWEAAAPQKEEGTGRE
jgi:WD40 repeat protein/serine/threonine protein kinase